MKVVIDIPEERYKQLLKDKNLPCRIDLECYITKGIPLPKGHGRLVDEKDLSLITVHLIDGVFLCDAPTIIEADKGE